MRCILSRRKTIEDPELSRRDKILYGSAGFADAAAYREALAGEWQRSSYRQQVQQELNDHQQQAFAAQEALAKARQEAEGISQPDLTALTQAAQHETHEAQEIYLQHADSCAKENNTAEAALFRAIAKIEQSHAERFSLLAQLMQDGALFRSGEQTVWMCLNCGHLHTGTEPPQRCPVCGEAQGFAVREQLAPFTLRQGEPLQ